jgi:hypothetical protein
MKYFLTKRKKMMHSGQAMMIATIFFLIVSMTIILGLAGPILRQGRIVSDVYKSRESYFLAESGIEDVIYRLRTGKSVGTTVNLSLNGGSASVEITPTASGKQVIATGSKNNDVRKIQSNVIFGTGIAFHYGIQSGQGGFSMSNSSSVVGNVFSGGAVIGNNNNFIYGDVVSAGSTGTIYGIHATGTAYAHNLGKVAVATTVDKDAYYQVKTNTTVNGTLHPGSADQTVVPLPISDAQINQWESDALAGGIMASNECDDYSSNSNTCTISTSRTIGPKKIPFNLLIKSASGIVTVDGPIWVTGNITTQTGPTIRMSPSLGVQNVAVIADNPSDTTGSGIIDIGQSTIFEGSGSPGSFVFLISQNNSGETGGSTDAVSMSQGASALVAYASHGQISLSQSVNVKGVTAYKIILSQSAQVKYDTGLPSTLFEGGPSGGYDISFWKEIQ